MINIYNSEFVFTDSGGLQRSFFLKKKCIVFRDKTEWREIIYPGANMILNTNLDVKTLKQKILNFKNFCFQKKNIFGSKKEYLLKSTKNYQMKILCIFGFFTGIENYVKNAKRHIVAVAIYEFLKFLEKKKLYHHALFLKLNLLIKKFFFKTTIQVRNRYTIYNFYIAKNYRYNFY